MNKDAKGNYVRGDIVKEEQIGEGKTVKEPESEIIIIGTKKYWN